MLSDRDYMRDEGGPRGLSWTVWLIIVLVTVFALEAVAEEYLGHSFQRYGALSERVWRSGWAWQLVSFQFLHGSFPHLFFNGLGVWMFGRPIEAAFGGPRMLGLWLVGGVVGGLLELAVGAAFHDGVSGSVVGTSPVVGASAGLMTFLAIFCRLEPDARILLALIVPVPARFLFYLSLGVALFFTMVPPRDGVAHAAHLGGLLYGWLWVQLGGHQGRSPWDRWSEGWRRWTARRRAGRSQARAASGDILRPAFRSKTTAIRPEAQSDAEFIAREVDPILEKIAREGIGSLTAAERQTLEAARQKVGRR
jgi:membrane associated rhomboid family serine protease